MRNTTGGLMRIESHDASLFRIETTMKWFRKYMHPYGKTVGFYDEAFPHLNNRTYRITKHFYHSGRIKHYATSYVGIRADGSYGVMWFRTLRDTLSFLRNDAPKMVEPS